MDMMPHLQVLVCTTAGRLNAIDTDGWPQLPGVRYLLSCQNPAGESLTPPRRPDIYFYEFDNTGLSVNRNQAMSAAVAEFVLIADDDTSFSPDGLRRIVDVYRADPSLDYATFRMEQPEQRVYPPDGYDLARVFRNYFPVSFEISFRRPRYLQAGLRFSELAGIGAPYLCAGEEDLVLLHARRAALKGRYFDTVIGCHPGATTSVSAARTPAFMRTKGMLMRKTRGYFGAAVRIPLEAVRSHIPFLPSLRYLIEGYIYSIRNDRLL